MNPPKTTDLLNRLLTIVSRSFPRYMQYAQPYIAPGQREAGEAIDAIITDQEGIAKRICQMLFDADQIPRRGDFPMLFTDKHDLAMDYLLNIACDYQLQDIESIDQLIAQLQQAPAAKALAEETLGMAKGHLETLREMVKEG
jgi:hypothetical protein